jgi:general secretion pathway protein C
MRAVEALNDNRLMIARLSAFVIWAFVAAATVFWGMRLLVRADPVPANAVVVSESAQVRGDLSRLLGAEPVAAVALAPQISTRFRLLGVMAAKPSPDGMTPGVALISIDGKPARAFAAGARVEDQLVLQNVSLRSASIGSEKGGSPFVLEIPALPAPATGALPRVTMDSASPSPPPQQQQGAALPAPNANPAASPAPPPGPRPARSGLGNPNASR